jgi:hypothetical protein
MLSKNNHFLKKHLLSCKDITHLASDYLASDYLDSAHLKKNASHTLSWKIRLHLLVCRCCARFVRHLKITQTVAPHFIQQQVQHVDADLVLQQIKKHVKHEPH